MKNGERCRVWSGPIPVPTLVAHPPPPPLGDASPPKRPSRRALDARTPARGNAPRARAGKRLHECIVLDDYPLAVDIYEARRRVDDLERARVARHKERAHVDEVIVIGVLLTFVPPLGVAMLWASRRFSLVAKIAVTVYAAFALVTIARCLSAIV